MAGASTRSAVSPSRATAGFGADSQDTPQAVNPGSSGCLYATGHIGWEAADAKGVVVKIGGEPGLMAPCGRLCDNRSIKEVAGMKRDDALRILAAHREEFVTMGVRELAIFGPVARDEVDEASDVDVLVEYGPGTRLSYLRVFELQERLEELLGATVDLVTVGGLRSELRDGILAEAIRAA